MRACEIRLNNAREDDQRDTVADAARRDLLTHPHQQHRAAGQRHNAGQDEEPGRDALNAHSGKAASNCKGLDQRESQCEVTRILVDLLAAGLAFLLQLLKRWRGRGQHLDDDRGRDVRHHVQGEHTHTFHRAAGKHVHVAKQAIGLALEELGVLLRVESRQRDERPEPVEDQNPESKQDPALQVLGFCKAPEIHVPSHLFGSIRHGPLDLPEKAFAA